MYNHYLSPDEGYEPVAPQEDRQARPAPPSGGGLGRLLRGLLGGEHPPSRRAAQSLSELLNTLGLGSLDTGDILLGLIVLFLILEDGDDVDLVIALALAIVLSLGEP